MTNEEMALQIQQGNNSLITPLWENVKKLMFKIMRGFVQSMKTPNYIDIEDIEQELYFSLVTAVNSYKPHKGYKLTTYLNYAIKNTLDRDILSTNQKNTQETSYNIPVGENEDCELLDLLPDIESTDFVVDMELIDLQREVRNAVDLLPSREKSVITLYWLENKTYKECGEILGVGIETVRQLNSKGLRNLRKNNTLKHYKNEITCVSTSKKKEDIEFEIHIAWVTSQEYKKAYSEMLRMKAEGENSLTAYNTFRTAEEDFKREYRTLHKDYFEVRYNMGLGFRKPHYN